MIAAVPVVRAADLGALWDPQQSMMKTLKGAQELPTSLESVKYGYKLVCCTIHWSCGAHQESDISHWHLLCWWCFILWYEYQCRTYRSATTWVGTSQPISDRMLVPGYSRMIVYWSKFSKVVAAVTQWKEPWKEPTRSHKKIPQGAMKRSKLIYTSGTQWKENCNPPLRILPEAGCLAGIVHQALQLIAGTMFS